MDIYTDLEVRTLINAAGTVTRYGGSLMAPEVLDAMRHASQQFCVLDELHERVGRRIASMLGVEAAYVTSSASAGLTLTTAACMAGSDPQRIAQLPDTKGMKFEVVIQKLHRIGYDQAIRLAGATLVEVPDDGQPPVAAMRAAVGEKTAAIFCMAHRLGEPASVSLSELVALANQASVPLIIDSASECPPPSTLKLFCEAGADLVIFSGGKSLMGPQSTGLVIGRRDLVAACAANGNPFATVGRPMKVSREEVVGFMKALELYLARDHDADRARWLSQIELIERALGGLGSVELQRFEKSATYTVPLLAVSPRAGAAFSREDIAAALDAGEPRIVVAEHMREGAIVINPHMLQPGQEQIVASRCRESIEALG